MLWTLPEAQHQAFVLRHWSGLSQNEIAQVLDTTPTGRRVAPGPRALGRPSGPLLGLRRVHRGQAPAARLDGSSEPRRRRAPRHVPALPAGARRASCGRRTSQARSRSSPEPTSPTRSPGSCRGSRPTRRPAMAGVGTASGVRSRKRRGRRLDRADHDTRGHGDRRRSPSSRRPRPRSPRRRRGRGDPVGPSRAAGVDRRAPAGIDAPGRPGGRFTHHGNSGRREAAQQRGRRSGSR